MKHQCPCCHKSLDSLPPEQEQAEDMDTLFSCDHCQSVLKWENQALKVVFESSDFSSESVEENESVQSEAREEGLFSEEGEMAEEQVSADNIMSALQEKEGDSSLLQEFAKEEEKPETVLDSSALSEPVEEPVVNTAEEEGIDLPLNELADISVGTSGHELEHGSEHGSEHGLESAESDFLGAKEEGQEEGQEEDLASVQEAGEASEESEAGEASEASETSEAEQQDINQDFSDVESYGNATATSNKGFLRYDLFIEGVDSHEIKTQVFHILEDPRFNWSAKEILQSEKEGVVTIKNLNPVKVMVLLSELSSLSVQLSWKQYRALDGPAED